MIEILTRLYFYTKGVLFPLHQRGDCREEEAVNLKKSMWAIAAAVFTLTQTSCAPDDGTGNDESSAEEMTVTEAATYYPALGSSNGGSPQWDYCIGKSDATPVSVDPRTLVQPGVNTGKAVYYNSFYKDCHINPAEVGEIGHAKTCGELRQRFYQGEALLMTGGPGVGSLFSGTDTMALNSGLGIATFTAAQYNGVWMSWNGEFLVRPSNFDQLVSERWGSGLKAGRNPYPKPGEDPNKTNGGTGQLPEMLTQLRDPATGKWSGRIGITCHACHSGVVGTPANGPGLGVQYGGSSSIADLNLFLRDMLPRGYLASLATLINLSHTRGTNNASDINLAFLFPTGKLLSVNEILGLITSGSTASMDTPAWWNMGHRPVKFVDGVFPMDAPRVDMVFYTPFMGLFGSLLGPLSASGQDWMKKNGPPLNTWVEALKSPKYPFTVDATLAAKGADLFHTLNMWDPARNNTVPKPAGGNGSCASCHGAYSPKYVNDPAFLDTPALEGVAGNITPLAIIKTDPTRVNTNNQAVQTAGAKNFFGYSEVTNPAPENYCGPQNDVTKNGNRPAGYLAPPLYGVWASAPYLHNGSVPNIWEVLKPTDRKAIWKRKSKPAPSWVLGQVKNPVMGFDTDINRNYDKTKLGWNYDTIGCTSPSILNLWTVTPYITCDASAQYNDPIFSMILDPLFGNLILAWNILFPPEITTSDIENRKIYNTKLFSQHNTGHDFNSVLTDAERKAIIEYLKTL